MAASNYTQILSMVTGIADSTARLEVKVEDLVKTVKGNGQPGLVHRVTLLEHGFGEHDRNQMKKETQEKDIKAGEIKKKERKIDFGTKVLLAVIGMILSNVGVLIFSLLK